MAKCTLVSFFLSFSSMEQTYLPHQADVFDLIPGTFQMLEFVAETEGTWLLHCHVDDHTHAGMETSYTIKSSGDLFVYFTFFMFYSHISF